MMSGIDERSGMGQMSAFQTYQRYALVRRSVTGKAWEPTYSVAETLKTGHEAECGIA